MAILNDDVWKFYVERDFTDKETQDDISANYCIDENDMLDVMAGTMTNLNYQDGTQLNTIIYYFHRYYKSNPELKDSVSVLNMLSAFIYELVHVKCSYIIDFIITGGMACKFREIIVKHIQEFEKNEQNAMLGGCYVVYGNFVPMLIKVSCQCTTLIQPDQEMRLFLQCFMPDQLIKYNQCIQMYCESISSKKLDDIYARIKSTKV